MFKSIQKAVGRTILPLLCLSGTLGAQSTLATFRLPEYFGVTWPVQNIEMRYDGGFPNRATTRMLNGNGVEIPYQWISGAGCWDSTAVNGCILVQDGLAANTTNTYTLQSGVAPAASVTNPVTVTSGTCRGGMRGWLISNGLTGFCVPQTQSAPYNFAPIQGVQLHDGTWTGAAAGTPNLIYHNRISGVWPATYSINGMAGGDTTLLRTPASIFTGETTTFVDAGPLKTSVRLSYTANKPLYYNSGSGVILASTASTITIQYSPTFFDCSTPILYFQLNEPKNPLPAPLQTNTPYYTRNCTVNGSRVSYSLSATPSGPIIANLAPFQAQVQGVLGALNPTGAGHLTVTLTLYANRGAFSYDFDTDLSIQDFVPLYAEVQPDTRRYRGIGTTSAACGYESPLTITNVTNTTPPTVTVSNQLNAVTGNQINISGVQGATGVNGTFYVCSANKVARTFTLHRSSGCSDPVPAPGAYISGGIGKPEYTRSDYRSPRDAYYDISYSAAYFPGNHCTAGLIPAIGTDYGSNWFDAGYYEMVYSSTLGSGAPVIGLFQGRLSKLYNVAGTGEPGWFSSNNHWIPQYNRACSSGTCAFGIEHMVQLNTRASTVHGNFGIYVGTAGQLPPPDFTQPIMREQIAIEGINLSSLYTYQLDYPDPQPDNPPNNGWRWPYMSSSDFNNWVSLFQHSAAFCTSTGSCSGDNGFYSKMYASEATSRPVQDMWHYNDAAHTAAAYNQVLNSGAGGESHLAIPAASWSGGTATITIGPHNISAGQLVQIGAFTPPGFNCTTCTVTSVTPTTISYSLSSNPGTFVSGGYVWELGVQGFVNVLANGDNRWQPGTGYYQLFLNQFGPNFPACAAIILNANATAAQKNGCKRILALAASLIWDNDWFPIGTINGTGQTSSGDDAGLANQQVQYSQYRSQASSYLYFHPYLATKLPQAVASTIGVYNTFTNQFGAGAGSMHYQVNYTFPLYQAFQPLALSGTSPSISFTDGTNRWQNHVKWYLSGLTPPEPRFGNIRKCLSNGDGNTEAFCAPSFGMLAEGLYPSDPATAGAAMWGWMQTNSNSYYTLDPNTVWLLNPLVPQTPTTLTSGNFPGYWSVARYGFNTPYETSVHFINGNFYSQQGHRHIDDGQVSIYALNAPLAIDWNANLYYPATLWSFCHNRILLDSELSGFGAWNNDAPDCTRSGVLLTPNETNFSAFTKSTQSIATFTYSDGTVWTRAVRTIAANPTYPLIYVKDRFSGPSATAPKTLTWNLMATGSVQAPPPIGAVTPIMRFSGPPNAPTGCNGVAAQYPSNGTVYPLQDGLEQFTFTGATWPAHAKQGINWDLWQIPTSGAAQFFIGNWGHGCNTSREMDEFQAVNRTAFNERQHILRVHDTGTFQTLIAPYRNGETPTRTVSMESCGIQIVQGMEVTCFDDSALTYTNGATQVLTIYDASMQAAFGWTAVGGAQELVSDGSGTLTWTIEDTVGGTRCVTLPPNASLQNGPGVTYNSSTRQYCYTQNASAQPTPATATFTLQ